MTSIRNFIDLNEDAKWLALKLLEQIPQDVLWPNNYDAPDLNTHTDQRNGQAIRLARDIKHLYDNKGAGMMV